jgi:outer membrane lipoprotein-sorting protein
MKKIAILFFGTWIAAMPPLSAQSFNARKVIEQAAETFRKAGGIEADFTAETYAKTALQEQTVGTIRMKGEKFVLESGGVQTWFDGHTQWSYLTDNNEVNITEPTEEELQSINPYSLLYIYKKGYDIKAGSDTQYEGRPAYCVQLDATSRKNDLRRITLYVDPRDYRPLCIRMVQRNDNSVVIRLTDYRTALSYPDSLFVFDEKRFPDVEIIDLR